MRRNTILFVAATVLMFAVAGTALYGETGESRTEAQQAGLQLAINTAGQSLGSECKVTYNPPSIEEAPASIRDAVKLGYNLMTHTGKYAARYVGNKLDCDDCHFKGGLTSGGKNGGLSIVGIGATYPQYRKRENYSVDLITRTNDCFRRSLNGRPLPPAGKEMTALVTYYQWISKGLPIYAEIPWLGLKHIESSHKPDGKHGKQLFEQKCSPCHGRNGQGIKEIAPPLWGKYSFNDGAGIKRPETFASFIHLNMPKGNSDLTDTQALDIAAFITAQPRPHFAGR
jgi:thiosulfate dehydrogenase